MSKWTIQTREYQLKKNLSRGDAYKQAVKKDRRDHRGFTYDPKTGKATLT